MIATTNNGAFPWRGSEAARDLGAALARGAGPGDLRPLQDRATRAAIAAQVAAGIDLPTDGLVRRGDRTAALVAGLAGLEPGPAGAPALADGGADSTIPVAAAEVAWRGPILVEDFLFATDGSPKPIKVPIPGPYSLARIADDRAYGDPIALAMALAFALNQELKALLAAGAACLQVDEPALLEHPADFPLFTRVWDVLGRGLSRPLWLHLGRGRIAPGLHPGMARLKRLAGISLDAATDPAGLAALLRESPWPEGPHLGLGLIDGRTEAVESKEAIAAMVRGLPGLPPCDRLVLGTASDLGGLDAPAAAAKLESLAGAARILATG